MSQMQQEPQSQAIGFPSVINFLQKEYRKIESERELWELERGEYKASINNLVASTKSKDKIQYDLIRRIKMLEFALRTERTRHRMYLTKVNDTVTNEQEKQILTDYENNTLTRQALEENSEAPTKTAAKSNGTAPEALPSNISQTLLAGKAPKSVQMIRGLLDDLNCSDAWNLLSRPSTITEESLNNDEFLQNLASTAPTTRSDNETNGSQALFMNGDNETPHIVPTPPQLPTALPAHQVPEVNNNTSTAPDQEYNLQKELADKYNIRPENLEKLMAKAQGGSGKLSQPKRKSVSWDFETDENNENTNVEESQSKSEANKIVEQLREVKINSSTSSSASSSSTSENQLVNHQHRAWKPKYVLASHLDGVRCVSFHDREPLLLSGSEDQTVKLWNVSKPSKRSNEPIQTFRGHTGPVFTVKCAGEFCVSAGADTTVRIWDTPQPDNNPYAAHGHATPFSRAVLSGHTDAIWSLSTSKDSILSASADGSIRMWNYAKIMQESEQVEEMKRGTTKVNTSSMVVYENASDQGVPTSVVHVEGPNKFVVARTDASLSLYDAESKNIIWSANSSSGPDLIYQCVSHPTLPMIVSAHDSGAIRFWDIRSSQCAFEMVGHKDAVSCLAFDPSGLYFMSGGHDSSLRVWDVQTKHCVQEIPTHRKKYDESIHSIAYHPTKTMVASAGADSIIKLFQ
ncbi:hypothetical protein AKO1_007552 [Acrasis kona]|uniref:Striatin N-terminal domain-containing protein n=1 Tax=Acrasis kona TaxID=1008807 RepID=A0AAW2YT18_9EUKA